MSRLHRQRALRGASVLAAIAVLASAAPLAAETYVWVDEDGVTQITNDPDRVPASAQTSDGREVDSLRELWGGRFEGPPVRTPPGTSGTAEDRIVRLLQGAVVDLGRGETARASATLRSILRLDPSRPEAHWYLALLAGHRGRYDSAEHHLRAFLSNAGADLEAWRPSAQRRLATLADERRLADASRARADLRLENVDTGHFRVELDTDLGDAESAYAGTVVRYLDAARAEVAGALGVVPDEPLGVVFYGRANYQRAHAHRFSFQTVGFFDGRIHVSSPAHPSGGLRSLLFHEYTHAVFREQTGGDRPYWLNEGLAEQIERRSRKQPVSTRSERASLHARIQAGSWLPLRRLGPSFGGLRDEDARAAYLQAILAAQWLEAHTSAAERARLLRRLGEGWSADQALHEAVGLDVDAFDAVLREYIRSEFPQV